MRPRRVAAKAGDLDVERVGGGHDRTGPDRELTDRNARAVVHAVDLLDAKTVHQPVLDHRRRACPALFGRLEDHDRVAGKVAGLGEITGRAEQHRSMPVMTAGVHLAGRLGGVGQIGLFLDRQRIHVGAQADHLDVAVAGGFFALDDADDTGLAEARCDLIAAEFPQPVSHECRSAVNVVQKFGMLMDIPAPGLNVGLQIGDAVDDGHEFRSGLVVLSSVACPPRSAQPSAAQPPSTDGASPPKTGTPGEPCRAPIGDRSAQPLTRPACSRPA